MTHESFMRARVVHSANGALQDERLPRPQPGDGHVLVKIHASGVNPLDLKIRAGAAAHARHPFPAILGTELAGEVVAVGKEVTAFRIGDEVYGLTGGVGGLPGSLAEFAAVDADLLALKPRNLTMKESAALPLGAITAWEGLVDRAAVKAGQKVLVHGGAGGVGHLAVQLAKAKGADVFATISASKRAIVEGFGAVPIDYVSTSVERYVAEFTAGEGFDLIYDTLGGATLDASFAAVRSYGGHVVSCLGWGTHPLAPLSFRSATYSGVFTLAPLLTGKGRAHHGQILREVARLAESGAIKPLIDSQSFTFETAEAAHERVKTSANRGKVVIEISSP
jgi:NADPH:quinone reductase-like Zn-dependent oxidoreductase